MYFTFLFIFKCIYSSGGKADFLAAIAQFISDTIFQKTSNI